MNIKDLEALNKTHEKWLGIFDTLQRARKNKRKLSKRQAITLFAKAQEFCSLCTLHGGKCADCPIGKVESCKKAGSLHSRFMAWISLLIHRPSVKFLNDPRYSGLIKEGNEFFSKVRTKS